MPFIFEEVTPEDWVEIEKELEKNKKGDFKKYIDMCAFEKLLGKKSDISNKHLGDLKPKIATRKMMAEMFKGSDTFKEKVSELAQYASAAQILGEEPQGKEEIISLIELVRKRNYEYRQTDAAHPEESAMLASLEVLLGGKPELIEAEWRVFEKIREECLPVFNSYTYIDMLKAETILGRKPKIPEKGWQKMRGALKYFKQAGNWYYFTKLAADMAILSADEVRIPEGGGLELIRHKKEELTTETPPMPETRQF